SHWYNCSTIGCGVLVNQAAHSGGTATCTTKAKCSTCGVSYGSVSTTNHTGGTEVKNAKSATCGVAGYTGDTYCKGCGAKTASGSTIAATGNHTGGEATCVATATCTTCGQSYGSVNANNHKNTEIRNASATYTGDTYCTDCGVKIASGSAITVNSAHTPYAVGANLMINNADSTNGWAPDMFNTSISAGTVVKEGSGSVAVTAKIPVGQASSIGAMTKLTFPATDLTPYGAIRIKVHFSHALPGTHQLQFNFITGEGGDGFNQIYTFTDYAAGWHEFTIDRATVPMAATASWSSINAIRFTWFNAQQSNVAATFTIDEIMAVVSIGHSPYAVGSDLMINNADSTNGWEDSLFNTTISKGTQISEGSGSVTFNSTIPVGQASNIGAMTKVNFPASNLTGFEKIRFKMHFSHKMSGTHQLQVNFITGDGGDGYNHVFTFTDYEAGWHEFIIDRASVAMAATADWASINAIRFTWFNLQQVNTTMSFTVDEIMALVTTSHNHSATGNIQYNETSHWYNCATIGCGVLVNQAAHSGGTATCNAKAKCSVCGYAYGGTNASNHAGGTEVRNASATYTGDTYCLGCGVMTAQGSAITPPAAGSAHTPYAVGTDLMINNADSTNGWDAALFNTTITAGSLVDEGTGSVAVNATVPVGQASSIGAMTKINFASTDLSSYEKFSFRMHVSHTLTGAHQLQFNFITGSGGDGYNYTITVADLAAGWHTVAINKNDIPMAATANWASINAIRFTWFNSQQIPTNVTFTFDKIMALAPGGHAPYVVGNNLMINNADSTSGWIPDMFNTSISAGTQIAEGSGSVTATAKVPVGQASSIGAMTKITFPAADLSSYGKISVKVYFSQKLTGTHQLQVNFITGEGGDGYNTVFTFTDYEAGWHEFIIDRASVAMAATANWASINAIRFTWFNLEQANIPMSFTFDSIMALPAGAHAPYAVGDDLMIHNADSTEGWAGFMHTSIYEGTQVSEGTGSVTMDPLYPYGQDGYIGAMSKLTFPATDLSSYKTITYDFYISDDLYGVHQFQTNFITGDGGDGYNYVYTFRDMAAGWHTMTIDMAAVPKAASTNATWSSINAIRFTWFNLEPIPTAVKFTFDNIMALKDAHQCEAGPYIYYNDENHWYNCTTEGCGLLVNEEPHYGGEATCIDRAYCAYCVKVQYGEIDPNNHVNTELLNASDTYTGDLYCYDCEKTVKKGTAITKTEATVTVATIKGSFKAGDKIAIPVTITEWANSYAYITVSVPEYNTSLLRFDGFEESDTGFQGAMVDYGNNGFVLIAAPSTSSAASKLRGGEVCILNFTALAELRAPVAVSVEVEANGYAYGAEDEWTTDRSLLVETKAGGTVFDDTTKPSVSIGSVTNHASSSQSLVLNFTDNGSIAGYYIGTSSTYLNNTYVATTAFIANYTVTAAGKYYINVVDASGNVSSAATVTFYMITLNANGGTVDTSKVLVKAGSTITLPTATKDNYKFSGWATTSSATTGATSITVNSNATYYAVWKNAIYGDSTGDSTITSVDALYVLQAVVGTRTLTAEQKTYCDVDGDGKITSQDALYILQHVVGKRTSFPAES
ncbi:MAG: InlB B-repeat-containing protein, partial [Clostridia bacterium]|nr:InlB B-repeat-containing protein [Clostridia bacterium]